MRNETEIEFQFYLSSIKRRLNELRLLYLNLFQFYLSSIKRSLISRFIKAEQLFQFYLSSIKSR